MNDLEDEREIMMYLRHEAGHAFNYAYRLYATPEWRRLFGPYQPAAIAITIGRCRSAASTCGTSRAGTRRSIPTRTSPRPSPCG